MKTILIKPRSTAIAGILLSLPAAILFSLIVLGIEPEFGPLAPLFDAPKDQPDVLGTAIAVGVMLLLPVAFFITSVPIVRTMRAGGSLFSYPVNLAIAAGILVFIAAIVGGIIVDQYPCWIGVPNCD